MVEANQAYHVHLSENSRAKFARAIARMAMFEARNVVKHRIRGEGWHLSQVRAKEISALASAMVEANRDEFIARAKASSVVQDELRRLYAKEAIKLLRRLARKSQHMSNSEMPTLQGLPAHEYHAQNGAAI
jgi:hypothetical protein